MIEWIFTGFVVYVLLLYFINKNTGEMKRRNHNFKVWRKHMDYYDADENPWNIIKEIEV